MVDGQPDDQPRDRRTTRVVGVEHLGEEQAEGHERCVDAILEFDPLCRQCRPDRVGVEDLVKGKELGLAKGLDLFQNPPSRSLGHCRPPCRTGFGSCKHQSLSQGGRYLSIPLLRNNLRISECHSFLTPFPQMKSRRRLGVEARRHAEQTPEITKRWPVGWKPSAKLTESRSLRISSLRNSTTRLQVVQCK